MLFIRTTKMVRIFLGASMVLNTLHADPPIAHFTGTLKKIDALQGYGPSATLLGLEEHLAYVKEALLKESLTSQEYRRVLYITEKLLLRYAYRDGSQRSRIYARAQCELINLLKTTERGLLIQAELGKSPLIQAYIKALS